VREEAKNQDQNSRLKGLVTGLKIDQNSRLKGLVTAWA
jgi:hypothetical protein